MHKSLAYVVTSFVFKVIIKSPRWCWESKLWLFRWDLGGASSIMVELSIFSWPWLSGLFTYFYQFKMIIGIILYHIKTEDTPPCFFFSSYLFSLHVTKLTNKIEWILISSLHEIKLNTFFKMMLVTNSHIDWYYYI